MELGASDNVNVVKVIGRSVGEWMLLLPSSGFDVAAEIGVRELPGPR